METQVIQMGFTTEQRLRINEYVQELANINQKILNIAFELESQREQMRIIPSCEKIADAGTTLLNLVK